MFDEGALESQMTAGKWGPEDLCLSEARIRAGKQGLLGETQKRVGVMAGTPQPYGCLAGFLERISHSQEGGWWWEERLPVACYSGQEGCHAGIMNRKVALISPK